MVYKVTLIPGDGIGPEVTRAAGRVLKATGVKFSWELAYAGERAQDMHDTPLLDYLNRLTAAPLNMLLRTR
jgi:isocitrate dehydrogenase (NAD+)